MSVRIDASWSQMSDHERRQVLDWIVDTALLFGSTRRTAYLVAAEFAYGLDTWAGVFPYEKRDLVGGVPS